MLMAVLLALFSLNPPAWAVDTNYQVGDGDVLKVTVYDNPDLDATVRVNSDGTIHFPLLGQVKVGGLSVAQVSDQLARKLADGYIVNPQVSVFVEEFRSKRAIIIGQVRTPGLYELSGPTSLLELVSKAGGLTPEAGDKATIKRKSGPGGDQEQLITVNLKDLLERGLATLDAPIMDGDNVFVAKAEVFYVTGEVGRPNSYRLEEGTTVIKAITMAGGFSPIASKSRVRIIRKVRGSEQILKNVSMDVPVLPEDVIVVPESFF
ncbi:hypothetical protein DESUT3_28520 [Desulfuromonas versatilis]|uniref:Periplasmic polysaccharide biosynthesis/export protein n=2 Tax=Desulfuromonas versatilis TaxID=2802975 RepID=A0ABN6E0A4_9BACT|nr:hypothetical protein DESUT3_28520 [Desulfuromonas versatilis]